MSDVSGKHRKSFSVRFKRQVVRAVEDMMKSGLSIRQAMDRLQIHHWYYARWKKVVTRVDDILQKDEAHPFDISGDIKKLHPGRPSSLTTTKEI